MRCIMSNIKSLIINFIKITISELISLIILTTLYYFNILNPTIYNLFKYLFFIIILLSNSIIISKSSKKDNIILSFIITISFLLITIISKKFTLKKMIYYFIIITTLLSGNILTNPNKKELS